MATGKWQRRNIAPKEVMDIIRTYGAPTTSEIKWELRTDSKSIRKPLAALMFHDKVFPMSFKGAIVWMVVDGKKGRPNPLIAREAVGKKTPRQEKTTQRIRAEDGLKPAVRNAKKVGLSFESESKALGRRLRAQEISFEFFQVAMKELRIKYNVPAPSS